MLPYFHQLPYHIVNDEDIASLRKVAELNFDKFWDYYSQAGNVRDGNGILGPRKMEGWKEIFTPGIKKLFSSINVPTYPSFIKHAPGTKVITHVDDVINKRTTVLSIPVWPRVGYSPTYFRDTREGPVVAEAVYEDMRPCLLNTRCWHFLENPSQDDYRLNFQLCFDLPIKEVAEMIDNKTLWKDPSVYKS